jgi:TolA-binding protein
MNRTPPLHRRPLFRWLLSVTALGGVVAIAGPAICDPVADLAQRLANLRGEVEELSAELARKDNDLRDQLRSLARQKAELKLDLQKEQGRLQKTQLGVEQKKDLIASEKEDDQALKPIFETAVTSLRDYVKRTLPFRTGERLAEIDKIEDQYKSGLLSVLVTNAPTFCFMASAKLYRLFYSSSPGY